MLLNKYMLKEMSIIDIGCGAGNDSLYFLNKGHSVLAIDRETSIIEKEKSQLQNIAQKRLQIIQDDFIEIELPKVDALYASFSLPFCPPQKFNEFWISIINSIKPKGIFAGIFFGENDEWFGEPQYLTFHKREDIQQLLQGYLIKEFHDKEYEGTFVGPDGNIKNKHWHIYEVIAIKMEE